MATKFLTKDSSDSHLDMIALINKMMYPIFGNLETAVCEGTTQWKKTFGMSTEESFVNLYNTEEAKLRFMGAMHCNYLYGSYAAAKAIDLSAYRSCCDLGGKSNGSSYTSHSIFIRSVRLTMEKPLPVSTVKTILAEVYSISSERAI